MEASRNRMLRVGGSRAVASPVTVGPTCETVHARSGRHLGGRHWRAGGSLPCASHIKPRLIRARLSPACPGRSRPRFSRLLCPCGPLGKWPQVGARGDQSRDVRLHQVGGKRAELFPRSRRASCTCVSRRTSTVRGRPSASFGFIPPPRLPLPLVPPGAVLPGAWGASEAGADVVATLTQGCGLLGRDLLLGGRGGGILTVHADPPHLGRCWSRRGNGRPCRRGRIPGSRQKWYRWTASPSFAARIAA